MPATTITITIQEDLNDRLKAVRGSVGNISKMCSTVIEHEVIIAEAAKNRATEDYMKRRVEEKKVYDKRYFQLGEKDAQERISVLSYEEICVMAGLGTVPEYHEVNSDEDPEAPVPLGWNPNTYRDGWIAALTAEFNRIQNFDCVLAFPDLSKEPVA